MSTQANEDQREDINSLNHNGSQLDNSNVDGNKSSSSQPKSEEVTPKKKGFAFIKKKPEGAQPVNSPENCIIAITAASDSNDPQKAPTVTPIETPDELFNGSTPKVSNNSVQQENKPQEKKKAFNFIKKQTSSSSSAASFTSPKSTQPSTELNSKEEPLSIQSPLSAKQITTQPKAQKDISEMIDAPYKKYTKETKENSFIMTNQLNSFKQLLQQLSSIRNEIQAETNKKAQLKQAITQLTEKQNNLIETNSFDEAIKVEEEIKANTDKSKQATHIIQLKTETDLHNAKAQLIELFKSRADQFSSFIETLSHLQTESAEAITLLDGTEKKSIDELSHAIELKGKVTDELSLEYQEALQQIDRTEGTYDKLFQEETKELTETITGLNTQQDELIEEIERLKQLLKEKEELLKSIARQINAHTEEKKAIKAKYMTEESYVKLIKSKDAKSAMYNESLQMLSELKSKHSASSTHYNAKLKEISNISTSISSFIANELPKNKQIKESIEVMKAINQSEHDSRAKIHLNERTIEDYLVKINENNEKIEVLDLQNKRIGNDIASLDTHIKNLDEVKKAHVTKKQFKDAQAVTLEIKKYNDKRSSLENLLNENDKEICSFKGEIEIHTSQAEELRRLIGEINEEINKKNKEYTSLYCFILKEIEQELIKSNDSDSEMISNEIGVIEAQVESIAKRDETKEEVADDINEEEQENKGEEKGDAYDKKGNDKDQNKESNEEEEITEQAIESTENPIKDLDISQEDLQKRIEEEEAKLNQAIENEEFEEADSLNQRIEELKKKVTSID